MNKISTIIEACDKQVDWHSKKFERYLWNKQHIHFILLLKGNNVLDFGCGNGKGIEFFLRKGHDLISIVC